MSSSSNLEHPLTPGKRKCNAGFNEKENCGIMNTSDNPESSKKSKLQRSKLVAPSKARTALPRPGFNKAGSVPAPAPVPVQQIEKETPVKKAVPTTTKTPSAEHSPLRERRVAAPATNPQSERKVGGTAVFLQDKPAITAAAKANEATKRLQRSLSSLKASDKIKRAFENGLSVNDEKILETITSKLPKTKSKSQNFQDYKDKAVKQAAVITDLRALFKTVFDEYKVLRESCTAIESSQHLSLREASADIEEALQVVQALAQNDTRLKKDMQKLTEEVAALTASLTVVQSENEPLKMSMKELEDKHWRVIEKLAAEEAMHVRVDAENSRLLEEVVRVKSEGNEATVNMRQEYEQRIEKSIAGYREEVAALRIDVDRRQKDAERAAEDRFEHDKKAADLSGSLVQLQSQVREAESNFNRVDKENARLSSELDKARASLQEKECDLRVCTASLHDIQRQSSDERSTLRADLTLAQARVKALEDEKLIFVADFSAKKEEAISLSRELSQLKEASDGLAKKLAASEEERMSFKEAKMQLEVERELRVQSKEREEAERRERIAACAQLLATQTDCSDRIKDANDKMNAETAKLNEEIAQKVRENSEKREEVFHLADTITSLETTIKHMQSVKPSTETFEELTRVTGEVEALKRRLRETTEMKEQAGSISASRLKELEEQVRSGEIQRRKMHNLIQELRGNVRVFARVRPFLPNDGLDLASPPEPTISTNQDGVSLRIKRDAHGSDRAEDHGFSFDKVFGPSSSQESVFLEVSEFVQSALDGFNVCLLSYGQTGSGKTHTMQGSGHGPMRGIIPRAMQQVGQYKTDLESQGWVYEMEVTFIEIYNESIRDLLRHGSSNDLKHEIKRDTNGNTTITDIVTMPINPNDESEIDGIMQLAARHRSVSSTAMNEQSSRSHSVFCLHLKATNASQGTVLKGSLSLVDLAGSERLDRSGATGAQAKETMAINKSLSSLTDVFVAIGNKQSHIPFRNSKLTYLLQPALSGDGKTLMMANLSPTCDSFFESLCSLRFASQVNQCELGKPKRQLVKDKDAVSASSAVPSERERSNSATAGGNVSSAKAQPTPAGAGASGLQKKQRLPTR